MPIVLLTYQPKSLPLYQRHGYVVVCEGAVAGSEVRGVGHAARPRHMKSGRPFDCPF